MTRRVSRILKVWLIGAPLLTVLHRPAIAIDTCGVKIGNDGTILVAATGVVGGALLWGPEAGEEASIFFNEATCLVGGIAKGCTLGAIGSSERITPPRLCTLYLADGSPVACSIYLKGCTPGIRQVGTDELVDASVTTPKLANDAVTSSKIKDGSVTAADLAPDSVGTTQIQNGAVTSSKILDGTITTADLAANAVGADQVQADAVTSAKIKDGSVTAADLAPNSVGTAQIQSGAVTSDKILDGSITGTDLAPNSVGQDQIQANAVTSDKIKDGSVTAADLAADSVGAAQIQTGAVTSAKILDGAITTADLAANAVGADQIQTGAVTSSKILDGTITTADLAPNAVGATQIQAGAVTSSKILDGTITAADLAPNSIGAAQIQTGGVTTSEILDGTITGADVADGSLTPAKIDFAAADIDIGTFTTATSGAITKGGAPFVHNAGSRSTFVGLQAGNFTTTGSDNTGVGRSALTGLTAGADNTGVGKSALDSATTGIGNTAVGANALQALVEGDGNLAVGNSAGIALSSGHNNVYIAHGGASSESNTLRVGTQGTQTRAYVAGVKGTSLTGSPVVVNSLGQLGEGTGSQMVTSCPADVGLNDKVYLLPPAAGATEQTRICASAMLTKSTPTDSLVDILETPLKQACLALTRMSTLQLNTFGSIFPEIAAAVLDALREPIQTAVNDTINPIISGLNGILSGAAAVVNVLNSAISDITNALEQADDYLPIDLNQFFPISTVYNPFNTSFSSVSVTIPAVSATALHTIVDAALANHPLVLLTNTLNTQLCDDNTQLDALIQQVLTAVNYLLHDVPGGTTVTDTTNFPRYSEAQFECAKRGAHICTMGELDILTRAVSGGTISSVLGYDGGEWVGGTGGDGVLFGDPDAGYVADWPPIEVDLQNLMQFPPGLPFSFKLPTIPTGKFRCCLSASPVV